MVIVYGFRSLKLISNWVLWLISAGFCGHGCSSSSGSSSSSTPKELAFDEKLTKWWKTTLMAKILIDNKCVKISQELPF